MTYLLLGAPEKSQVMCLTMWFSPIVWRQQFLILCGGIGRTPACHRSRIGRFRASLTDNSPSLYEVSGAAGSLGDMDGDDTGQRLPFS